MAGGTLSRHHRLRGARPRAARDDRAERAGRRKDSPACRRISTTARSSSPTPVRRKIAALRAARRARSSAPMPTAAPAASSTACSPRKASSACPARIATPSMPASTPSTRSHDEEPGTFYLTDFLARHFDRLIVEGPRPRPPSRAVRRLFPQLPPPRLSRPGAVARPCSRAPSAPPRFSKLPLVVRETGFGLLESEVLARVGVRWPTSPSSTGATSRPR